VRASVLPAWLAFACAHGGGDLPPAGLDAREVDAAGADGALDAASAAPQIVWVGPDALFVPRGSTATLGVNLDRPAGPGGLVLTVESDDPAGRISHNPTVTVAQGQASAQVVVSGIAIGGPVDVSVTLGSSSRGAQVRVVPAIQSLAAPRPEIVVGETVDLVMTLESPADVDVTVNLLSSNMFLAAVPSTATVPAGSASGTVSVTGMDLGGVVTVAARIGDATAAAPLRVGGLYLSEVFYDVTGVDDQREWIELYNATSSAIPMAGMKIQMNNGATSGFEDVMLLSGGIAPGACVVVGGPLSGAAAANFTPEGFLYEVTEDFTTDLGNAGAPGDVPEAPADAIQLVLGSVVLDSVIYGRNNGGSMTDENGQVPTLPEAPDVDPGQSLERTAVGVAGPWRVQTAPNPAACSAIMP
jgi:hypothetical protein